MFGNIKTWLMRKFMPSAEQLAGYAADGIQKSVNGTDEDVRELVARYASYAEVATRTSNKLAAMVQDGTIDDAERDALRDMLTPAFERVLLLV